MVYIDYGYYTHISLKKFKYHKTMTLRDRKQVITEAGTMFFSAPYVTSCAGYFVFQ